MRQIRITIHNGLYPPGVWPRRWATHLTSRGCALHKKCSSKMSIAQMFKIFKNIHDINQTPFQMEADTDIPAAIPSDALAINMASTRSQVYLYYSFYYHRGQCHWYARDQTLVIAISVVIPSYVPTTSMVGSSIQV